MVTAQYCNIRRQVWLFANFYKSKKRTTFAPSICKSYEANVSFHSTPDADADDLGVAACA